MWVFLELQEKFVMKKLSSEEDILCVVYLA